jgi:predicted adenine nucleotide alpha hydrolase (AANH) superfamily ATPase
VKLLLHTCCGPCTVYPLRELLKDYSVSAFFFNPNIHPFQEFKKRRNSLREYCETIKIPIVDLGTYGLQDFLRKVVFHEKERCATCYAWRMDETAKKAAESGFDCFTTTLLYSRYQDHEKIKRCGFSLAEKYGVEFIYRDFREGWQYGIDKSIELGMYRQPYCGCIYSEQERYDKSLRKKKTSGN